MKRKIITLLSASLCLTLIASCGSARKAANTIATEDKNVEMTVFPDRNGGAPETLQLTIKNNTDKVIQFGANYSVERLVGGKWVGHDLGNFAVIAIMYSLQPGDSGQYSISLFTDRVSYPESDYRVVKNINVGESESRPYYAGFKIIEPR